MIVIPSSTPKRVHDVHVRRGGGRQGEDAGRAPAPLFNEGLLLLFEVDHRSDLLDGLRVVLWYSETHDDRGEAIVDRRSAHVGVDGVGEPEKAAFFGWVG